ncbi:hypothetical protein MMC30_005531 [Trapelia coarctata]|nr:hypothetical protein [Trapelia coarctata]
MAIVTALVLLSAVVGVVLWRYLRVPRNFPKNIPCIPIYVSLLGLWSDMGQDEIYDRWLRKPLEHYGAVKFWFAGRWSILVTQPEYLSEVFRNEEVHAKAGNQVKIPWSVLASLLGDNIISAHGENWRLYTSIMRPGIAKRGFDTGPLLDKSRKFVDLLLRQQLIQGKQQGVVVNPLLQRLTIDVVGQSFLDKDFKCLETNHTPIEQLQSAMKRSIFKPLYMNFPSLDKYPWLFRSRRRAFMLVHQFETILYNQVRSRSGKSAGAAGVGKSDSLIHLLEQALLEGKITDNQFRANLKITFITGHENVQLLLNSMFWQIGKNQEVQHKLREEIQATGIVDPSAETLNTLPYLTSVIFELLRLYPPISQLTNRATTQSAAVGDISIPSGTWVGWNAYGVHTDRNVWGSSALDFIPERWGRTVEEMQLRYRKETVRGAYIPFNAYTRKCIGQGFALLEMKMVVFELVRRVCWKVDPSYKYKLPGAGVLTPVGCRVMVEDLQEVKRSIEVELDDFADLAV